MERINIKTVNRLAQELGITLTAKSSRQISRIANQECQRSQELGGNFEPETVVSMALLAVAKRKKRRRTRF